MLHFRSSLNECICKSSAEVLYTRAHLYIKVPQQKKKREKEWFPHVFKWQRRCYKCVSLLSVTFYATLYRTCKAVRLASYSPSGYYFKHSSTYQPEWALHTLRLNVWPRILTMFCLYKSPVWCHSANLQAYPKRNGHFVPGTGKKYKKVKTSN